MPSPNERRRNNIRTGIFVTVTLVLAVVIIVQLTDWWDKFFGVKQHYTVVYPVSVGVKDLKPGSEVRIGGMNMGRVESVTMTPDEDDDGALRDITVEFALDGDARLYAGADIFVMGPLLGADAWLEIPHVGSPEHGQPEGGVFEGAVSESVLALLSNPDHPIIRNTTTFTEFLAQVPQKYKDDVQPIFTNVEELTWQMTDVDWPRWAGTIDEVMRWALRFTENLDAAVMDGRELLDDADDLIVENRENIDQMVGNLTQTSADVQSLAGHLNTETVGRIDAFLGRAQDAVDTAIETIERVQVDYEGWSVDVEEALGDAQATSQQLKLASVEIRRSPWKLLYRPKPDEIQHELLYNATRSFAMAVADLSAAATSTQRMLDNHGEELKADAELLESVKRNLMEPLKGYEAAQERMLKVLFEESP